MDPPPAPSPTAASSTASKPTTVPWRESRPRKVDLEPEWIDARTGLSSIEVIHTRIRKRTR